MNETRNQAFLNWEFGHTAEWPVHCCFENPPLDPGDLANSLKTFQRWADVSADGPHLRVSLGDATGFLEPSSNRATQEIRRWIKSSPASLARLQLDSPYRRESSGGLQLTRTPRAIVLEAKLPIALTQEVRLASPRPQWENRHWASQITFQAGTRNLMLMTLPSPGGENPYVCILAREGMRLRCTLEPVGAFHCLRVIDICEGPFREPLSRLIELKDGFWITDDAPESSSIHLGLLEGKLPPTLQYWLRYERLEADLETAETAERQKHPLEFRDPQQLPHSRSFILKLPNPGEAAIRAWLPAIASRRPEGRTPVDISIALLPHSPKEQEANARLVEIQIGAGVGLAAVIELEEGSVPPTSGRITPVQSWGNQADRDRRRKAAERLFSGSAVAPDLLHHLTHPEDVPEVEAGRTRQRPGAPTMAPAQLAAVLGATQEPPLFLIQGPPGTGKTFVVAEIIAELLHRHRKAQRGSPLRILVSSSQNDAVRNLHAGIERAGEGVVVYVDENLMEAGQAKTVLEGMKQKVSALEIAYGGQPRYQRYDRLLRAQEAVTSLASFLVGAIEAPEAGDDEAILQRFQEDGGNWTEALGPALRADREGLLQGMLKAVEFTRYNAAASPDPALAAAALWLEAHRNNLVQEDLPEAHQVVTCLLAGEDQWPDGSEDLAVAIRNLQRALERGRGLLTPQVQERLRTLPALPSSFVLTGSPASSSVRHRALAWAERATKQIDLDLKELTGTEEAVLHDWVKALREEPATMQRLLARYAPIEAHTTSRAARAFRQNGETQGFDVAIVDEAARSGLDILIPMTLGQSVILVGDDHQLPPYVEDALIRRMDRDVAEAFQIDRPPSLFEHLWQRLPANNRVSLNLQRRMHENIGSLVSQIFYEPAGLKLEHYYTGPRADSYRSTFGLFENEPLVWVDTRDQFEGPSMAAPREWPCQEVNTYEVDLAAAILVRISARLTEQPGGSKPVGLITFYSRQQEALKALVGSRGWDEWVDVGTVDSFQGKEYPLVILSCVRSNASGTVGFLAKLPHRINVAFSRAQRQLVIIGDSGTLAHSVKGSEWLKQAFNLLKAGVHPGRIVPSREAFHG